MSDEQAQVNMDEMWESGVDKDALQQGAADLLMPKGSYVTMGPRTMNFNTEVHRTGRPAGAVAHFYGEVVFRAREKDVQSGLAKEVGQEIGRGRVGFDVSPLRVNAKDNQTGKDLGKPDRIFRLWMQANTAYRQAFQQEPLSKVEVLNFLRDYPEVGVFVTQYNVPTERDPEPEGDPGNSVSSLYIPKEQ